DAIVWASGGTVAGIPPNPTPARVINMSLGGEGQCPQVVQHAIDEARGRGTVVVVSAGNSALPASTSSPANCQGVIAVAAVGRTGARASYSNFGYGVTVAAPGGDGAYGILSTLNDGVTKPRADNYVSYQGTSMAAPHVAGVVALMLSVNPSLTPDQVALELKASARPGGPKCRFCGAGLLDADAAVTAAMGPPPAEPPPAMPLTEVEPNNTRATAQKSTFRHGIVTGSLSSATDNDYYAVTVAPGRYLAVLLKPAPTADLDLYVYDSAGALIGKSIQGGLGFTDQAYVGNFSNADATMYLRVVFYKAAPGADAVPKAYTLEWAAE
ncbi:MAG TPA: S8 family serine peptidase, partial [Burkholderiaceae bacterium]|nr:S8 family serine peptidase [Burkholderiaceae bacterium]